MTENHRTKIEKIALYESSGDIDSIMVYGGQTQSKLADFSKTVANVLATSNATETERLLENVIDGLDQTVLKEKGFLNRLKNDSFKRYRETIESIDKMTVNLRIRQAQLLKDYKTFEQMEELMEECLDELDVYLRIGENRLLDMKENGTDTNNTEWESRFEKKLEELRFTHIVAMQSSAQIKLMRQNQMTLIEKMGALISNTIPLWINQASAVFGIEQYEKDTLIQKKIADAARITAKDSEKIIRKKVNTIKKKQLTEKELADLKDLNGRLEQALVNLKQIEETEHDTEKQMGEILWNFQGINNPIKLSL